MPRTTEPLAVALIGYGLAGEAFHAPLVATTPGLRLATVVTSDPARAARARRDHPGVRVVDRAERLWESAGAPDLVVVATPNRTHVPLARAAVAAGVAVVVDKPLAATAADARDLVRAAADAGVPLTVFQNRRWDGDFRTVARLVADGALGTVLRFESRFERWRPDVRPGWRERGELAEAGGVLYDLGAHLVDQALTLFGPLAGAGAVYAEVDRRRQGAEVDDDVFVALRHASGVRSHLWMSAVTAQLGPRLRVLGDRAGYTKYGLDIQEAALRSGRRPGADGWGDEPPEAWGRLGVDGDTVPVPTLPGAYPEFYRLLAAALRDGGPLPVDPADAVAALAVLEAARAQAHR